MQTLIKYNKKQQIKIYSRCISSIKIWHPILRRLKKEKLL